MTAEIAVMNTEAVVLAADSAVTSRIGTSTKIHSSANKLFALSMHHPVGIMFYGSAVFMDVPWETIIKVYRKNIQPKAGFNTLEEYADNFISYLSTNKIQLPTGAEERYVASFSFSYLRDMNDHIMKQLRKALKESDKFDEDVVKQIARNIISNDYQEWQGDKTTPLITKTLSTSTMRKYHDIIDEMIEMTFGIYNLSRQYLSKLKQILIQAFSKIILPEIGSGIVVAGFGEDEIFPSIKPFIVEGMIGNKLKYKIDEGGLLGKEVSTGIGAFAQNDMVQRFMNGVDPLYRAWEMGYVSELCSEYAEKVVKSLDKYNEDERINIKKVLTDYGKKLSKDFDTKIQDFMKNQFSTPIVTVVSSLPKNELATIAEALVYLTSLKRKVSLEPETVAEPIDVAVISKGDGFVWIKRKHYFKAELNPMFLSRYS